MTVQGYRTYEMTAKDTGKEIKGNMARMTNYVYKQAGNAIDATIQILGVQGFLDELHARETKPTPKYQVIIDEAKRCLSDA